MRQPRETPPTIYDVAALAGASISTVSRVLNAPERVNEATRTRVLAAIDQLGYVPKAEARARALQGTRRIGVATPFLTAPSFVQRLRGIDAVLEDFNYELIIYTVESLDRLKGYLATLPLTGNLDGLIIMSLPVEDADARRIVEHQLETVLIELHQPYFSSVEIDDFEGGRMAAQYLLDHGHCHLAFLGDIDPPDYAIRPVVARFGGFSQALAEAGVPLPDEYVRSCRYSQEASRQAARALLALPEPPTAIFAAADVQAIAIMRVARDLGLRIPGDLAIIGFDDLDMADYVGLTTVRQSLDDSGRIAAELLLGRLADPERPLQHVRLPLTIVERDTV
jgi:DNA-binding LacI/PurR family transcriptional regulator